MIKKITILMLLISSMTFAQKVWNLDKDKPSAKTYELTSDTAIYNSVNYPVYKSKKGKYFILVVSKKTGKEYRKYIG